MRILQLIDINTNYVKIMDRIENIAERFIELLRDRIDSESGHTIVMKMLDSIDKDEVCGLISECEDMIKYRDFLSEDEAKDIVSDFVNFDGSKGAHWNDPDSMFRALTSLDIDYDVCGEYNKWAFFAVMNMIWSDEWGVLRNYADQDKEVRLCAELAVARLEDKDKVFSVRRYFEI